MLKCTDYYTHVNTRWFAGGSENRQSSAARSSAQYPYAPGAELVRIFFAWNRAMKGTQIDQIRQIATSALLPALQCKGKVGGPEDAALNGQQSDPEEAARPGKVDAGTTRWDTLSILAIDCGGKPRNEPCRKKVQPCVRNSP